MAILQDPFGIFVYWSFVAGVFTLVTIYLGHKEKIPIIAVEDQVNFIAMKNTSSVAMALNPRTDAEDEANPD
jgi:hypothetical protein